MDEQEVWAPLNLVKELFVELASTQFDIKEYVKSLLGQKLLHELRNVATAQVSI